jgi:transcription elongation factor Elf1
MKHTGLYCLICEPLVELIEQPTGIVDIYDQWFYQDYTCPNCGAYHRCSSQSGDMIQENLDIIG